ncbi:Planctomycete cytochrome C [Planctomycetales bacterium 10988]|nr:Planctomycete cytochrome C [Planctomycetales bacterium 10988]
MNAQELEFFEKKVRPLLAQHCYSCHSTKAETLQAGLYMDSRQGLLRGGDSGPAFIPGDSAGSLLMEAVRYESYAMPPEGMLAANEIEILQQWIDNGAKWPEEASPVIGLPEKAFDLEKRKAEHWAWQPIESPEPPAVLDASWPRQTLDYFILKQLENERLNPTEEVDRAALLRRLYFDLIGLPPTADQVQAFLSKGNEPAALEEVVDELLESPHFGERWGRHWLDLVRYAESRGHEFDNDASNAYQYRDYIIRALNADVPYDQLVREHLAGDLLETPRLHPETGGNESILGTGFWFLGEWVHSPVDIRKDEADRFDNMIDVMSKTFLGLTVACARCHDHKFDAIASADYYALSGFLQSSQFRQVRFQSMEHNRNIARELKKLDTKYRRLIQLQLEETGRGSLPTHIKLPEALADKVIVDYGKMKQEDFRQDGFLFGQGPRRLGTPSLLNGEEGPSIAFEDRGVAASDPFWHGLEAVFEKGEANRSKLYSLPRSGRSLRTPTFKVTQPEVACRVEGAGHVFACVDSHRLVAGPLHSETLRPFKSGQPWVKLNLARYVGHHIHLEFIPAKDQTIEVSLITQGASTEDLEKFEAHQLRLSAEVDKAYPEEFLRSLHPLAAEWAAEREKLKERIQHRSEVAMAMLDGSEENDTILIRGNASNPGKIIPRRFLSAIEGEEAMPITAGSGRLELAAAINDRENPLTTRVIVNRLWHHLMGRGIVASTDDFGVLGQRPTHPELLDHLAIRFVKQGQSLKKMVRYLVLSRTYAMSSHAHEDALAADPKNLLWHYRPPQRLEGEVIRDALLAISGQLDRKQFGESIPIHLTDFMTGRGRPKKSGPLDGDRRRSIYITIRRNFISPFMLAFDTPVPFSTMGRRNVSNVPAQALILLNDPFVRMQAQAWAEAVLAEQDSFDGRVDAMYLAAFGRSPTKKEKAIARGYLSASAADANHPSQEQEAWSDYAHALINTKEFIFLR